MLSQFLTLITLKTGWSRAVGAPRSEGCVMLPYCPTPPAAMCAYPASINCPIHCHILPSSASRKHQRAQTHNCDILPFIVSGQALAQGQVGGRQLGAIYSMVVQDVPQQLLISNELSHVYSHGFKAFVDCLQQAATESSEVIECHYSSTC